MVCLNPPRFREKCSAKHSRGPKSFRQVYEATIKLDELFAPRRAQKAGLLGTRFRLAKSWGGGSCRRIMPVLSEAEGNRQSELPSSHDSSVLVDFHACVQKTVSRGTQSKPERQVGVERSNRRPCRGYVRRNGVARLQLLQHRRNRRRSAGCNRNTLCFAFFAPRRALEAGLLGTRFRLAKSWRRGESNPRPKSATKRSLHA